MCKHLTHANPRGFNFSDPHLKNSASVRCNREGGALIRVAAPWHLGSMLPLNGFAHQISKQSGAEVQTPKANAHSSAIDDSWQVNGDIVTTHHFAEAPPAEARLQQLT